MFPFNFDRLFVNPRTFWIIGALAIGLAVFWLVGFLLFKARQR